MSVRIGRIIIFAFSIEVLAILTLVMIVAIFGPTDPVEAKAYSEKLGYWVGPITGFILCLFGGWWIGKGIPQFGIRNGFILGLTVAIIDIAILLFSGTKFQTIFALSNIGRIIAGSIGGWIASRSRGV